MKVFFTAIKSGNLQEIKQLVEKNPKLVNSIAKAPPKSDEGKSPLKIAIEYNNVEIANYLLENGANVNFMEEDKGIPSLQRRRIPILSFTIVKVFSCIKDFKYYEDWEKYENLILRMLFLGADPNKADNWGTTSWMHTILSYSEVMWTVKDDDKITLINRITLAIFAMLVESGSDIYYVGTEDILSNYRRFIVNTIFNQDLCYGVSEEEREVWKQRWERIATLIKPYYVKDNPYYGFTVSIERKILLEKILTDIPEKIAVSEKHNILETDSSDIAITNTSIDEINKVYQLVEAILKNNLESVLDLIQEKNNVVNYVLSDNSEFPEYNGQSMFEVALNSGSNTMILHAIIDYGLDINAMKENVNNIPEDSKITYCDGIPVFYEYNSEIIYLPQVEQGKEIKPIIQEVLNKIIMVAGLGGKDYADALTCVAIHLLDCGADPNKKDSHGYTVWMKLLCTAQMITSNIPNAAHMNLFLVYLEKCLRLLIEYKAEISEISIHGMNSVEDIVQNLCLGNEPLTGLKEDFADFWNNKGLPLLNIIQKYYSAEYDEIISDKVKRLHSILGDKRYLLMTDIVDKMEMGDLELIEKIAGLFRQENTKESIEKAEALLALF